MSHFRNWIDRLETTVSIIRKCTVGLVEVGVGVVVVVVVEVVEVEV